MDVICLKIYGICKRLLYFYNFAGKTVRNSSKIFSMWKCCIFCVYTGNYIIIMWLSK